MHAETLQCWRPRQQHASSCCLRSRPRPSKRVAQPESTAFCVLHLLSESTWPSIIALIYLCAGMWVPGATGLVVGALLLLLVRDSPEAVGYPPVETVEAKPKEKDGSDAPKESLMSLLLNNVLKNPFIWGMAFTYFFVYVVRQGVTSWFVFYLIKVKNHLIRLWLSRPHHYPASFLRTFSCCLHSTGAGSVV